MAKHCRARSPASVSPSRPSGSRNLRFSPVPSETISPMREQVLVTLALPAGGKELVIAALPDAEIRCVPDRQAQAGDFSWAGIILGNVTPPERIWEFPNIRWLH